MVMTTTGDRERAATLARAIVEARLAACVQILDVRSVFTWEGSVDDTAEALLLIKTRADLYEELETFIRDRHDYDVPEILQVPITRGFAPYLGWVGEVTRRPAEGM